MLTRFISDKSYGTLDIEYSEDSNVKIDNTKIGVDGNFNFVSIPTLSDARDLKINNHVLSIITKKDNLSNLVKFEQDNDIKNKMCNLYSLSCTQLSCISEFFKFETNFISISTTNDNYDDFNIFELDILDENNCKLYFNNDKLKYVLAYSLSLSSLKPVLLNDSNINLYTTTFNYQLNDKKIIFYVDSNVGKFALKNLNKKLSFLPCGDFEDGNCFNITRVLNLNGTENQNNWISYKNTFNTNNLKINNDRSHFDIENNFLLTTTIGSIVSSLPINILTLKNQLNQENDQSRGGVFLNENETSLKEYESIFTGGFREHGYDKIHLGFTSYSTPFLFKSGKTTYFHVPHDIYPYEKLNVNSSKLVESGAIGGNSPLNSDKIWKKLRDYRDTTPYSDPQEEQSGQWLCTWLSAGNPDSKPIWMDRYYKPSKSTAFEALSAVSTEIIYIDSFNCLNLKENISDVKSSLTFEKGVYYAYMHLGRNDYLNLITQSISSKTYNTDLDDFKQTNYKELAPIDGGYEFDGKRFGYIDSRNKFEHNVASFSFFMDKKDWSVPSGNMVFGNYVNNGFGFYNYNFNTPYSIFKYGENSIHLLNNNFEKIEEIITDNITLCGVAGISRKNGFENIHFITNDFNLIETDLRGTILDSNSAIKTLLSLENTDKIYSITNDDRYCYVHTSSGVASIDLYSNNVSVKNIIKTITTEYVLSSFIIADEAHNLYEIYGNQPIYRKGIIYTIGDNKTLSAYSTKMDKLSSYIDVESNIRCFNIDSDDMFNIITESNELSIYDEKRKLTNVLKLSSLNAKLLIPKNITYCERFEHGKLKKTKQVYCETSIGNYPHILEIDESHNQKIFELNRLYRQIQPNLDHTNYNFNRSYLNKKYDKNSYNFKVKLLNRVDYEDFEEIDFVINGNDLGTGLRHFVFSIDAYNGLANFFLDGQLYSTKNFKKRKYTLSNTFNGRIFYGSSGYFNGVPAFKHFKDDKDFTCSNIKIRENRIINKALDRFEALYFYNLIFPSNDLNYNMPSGTRSFIDKIERTFNFNVPMFKSNVFNLKILNSKILSEKTRKEIEDEIRNNIVEYLPTYTKLNNLEWLDTGAKSIVLEGDYNVSNTLTNVL